MNQKWMRSFEITPAMKHAQIKQNKFLVGRQYAIIPNFGYLKHNITQCVYYI